MRADLFGLPIDCLTMDETVERCEELIRARRPSQHVVLNAAKVVMVQDVPGLREIVRSCDVVNADGQSIVWAGRILGVPVPERVAGIDLMERLLVSAETNGWPVFFLGAREHVLQRCIQRVEKRHPKLIVAGAHHGYFEDAGEVAKAVRDSGARIVFVGISSPKKEFFLSEHLRDMGDVFAMGVGGSFDVLAGVTRRAPRWMQRAGLEWFYRFVQEPRRMWKRYVVGNARFVWMVLREQRRARGQESQRGG